MNHKEYMAAADYYKEKDLKAVKISRDELQKEVENYIQSSKTCALATGTEDFVRNSPVQYEYFDGSFWIFSGGGLKYIALEKNKNVSIAIYDRNEGTGELKGMQIAGIAEIVEPFSEEYNKACTARGINIEAIKEMATPLILIRVIPRRIEYLNSDFTKKGLSSRQVIDY